MRTKPLTEKDHELIQCASSIICKRKSAFCTVGCALRTMQGKIFTGVNIESIHSGPCSMCAEYPAIGAMYGDTSSEIETIVAVDDEEKILPPCGRCREMIRQFGNPFVILQYEKAVFKVQLSDLIPLWESGQPHVS